MGLFGRLLSLPVKVVNLPFKIVEEVLDVPEDERVMSKPLDAVADVLEEIDE